MYEKFYYSIVMSCFFWWFKKCLMISDSEVFLVSGTICGVKRAFEVRYFFTLIIFDPNFIFLCSFRPPGANFWTLFEGEGEEGEEDETYRLLTCVASPQVKKLVSVSRTRLRDYHFLALLHRRNLSSLFCFYLRRSYAGQQTVRFIFSFFSFFSFK